MQHNSQWHRFASSDEVAAAASAHILTAAAQAIAERGQFKLVLAGGTTPEKVYRLLAHSGADWANWRVYYGDERCLPPTDPERNSQLAAKALLEQVPIPRQHIFTMAAELGPEQAAAHYQDIVAAAVPFDMVLLGLGEDGHTASLFPGHQHNLDQLTHPVHGAPKPPPQRVTLSAKALGATRAVVFLVTGANKREAVAAWRAGASLPAATISPPLLDIYCDEAALPAY